MHDWPQMGITMAFKKNGNQQHTKTPVMIARVLAAFFSRRISRLARICWRLLVVTLLMHGRLFWAAVGCGQVAAAPLSSSLGSWRSRQTKERAEGLVPGSARASAAPGEFG